jgi:hypothetical protein
MPVPNMNAKLRQILVTTDGDGYRVLFVSATILWANEVPMKTIGSQASS